MSGDYLRRYTDLTALIYLLQKRKLTLLDPSSWDDRRVKNFFVKARLVCNENNHSFGMANGNGSCELPEDQASHVVA